MMEGLCFRKSLISFTFIFVLHLLLSNECLGQMIYPDNEAIFPGNPASNENEDLEERIIFPQGERYPRNDEIIFEDNSDEVQYPTERQRTARATEKNTIPNAVNSNKNNNANNGNGNGNGNSNGNGNNKKNNMNNVSAVTSNETLSPSNKPNDNGVANGQKKPKKPKKNKRLCEIKHTEYVKKVFADEDFANDVDDTDFDGRVLAHPGEYPHMCALGYPTEAGSTIYQCGGSLISEHFVVTAAHCTTVGGINVTLVRIGDLNLNVEEGYLKPQMRNVTQIFNHPDYSDSSYYNDIALLRLASNVQLTKFVFPIRLWVEDEIPYDTAYAMGYGATAFAKAYTNRLTDLNMTIVPNTDCNRQMPITPESQLGILPTQICAKDFIMNRDTCTGDSGGPLQLNLFGRRQKNRLVYHLIGITSYGMVCRGPYPGVYTRISSYLDWIERTVWSDQTV